jgi:hypothetical protein
MFFFFFFVFFCFNFYFRRSLFQQNNFYSEQCCIYSNTGTASAVMGIQASTKVSSKEVYEHVPLMTSASAHPEQANLVECRAWFDLDLLYSDTIKAPLPTQVPNHTGNYRTLAQNPLALQFKVATQSTSKGSVNANIKQAAILIAICMPEKKQCKVAES